MKYTGVRQNDCNVYAYQAIDRDGSKVALGHYVI
jgi:hypothetical protein